MKYVLVIHSKSRGEAKRRGLKTPESKVAFRSIQGEWAKTREDMSKNPPTLKHVVYIQCVALPHPIPSPFPTLLAALS